MSRLVGVSSISFSTRGIEDKEPQRLKKEVKVWEDLIDTAAWDKPDIILLPEGFLQNTVSSCSKEEKNDKSELLPRGGVITKFISRKAKEHKTYILVCYWRKNEKGKGRYNSAVLFNRKGKIAGVYDKTFPTRRELEEGILPGKGAKVFQTDFGRIGAFICFDFFFRELVADYKNKGVELICFLSGYRGGLQIPIVAYENQIFVASSSAGGSVIVNPVGRILAESSMFGNIIFSKINLDFKIVHITINQQKIVDMKKKYGQYVKIEAASPEAIYLLSSFHPEKSIEVMIREFKIETFDEYLNWSRKERRKYLPRE